jgi:hypothetical protein
MGDALARFGGDHARIKPLQPVGLKRAMFQIVVETPPSFVAPSEPLDDVVANFG